MTLKMQGVYTALITPFNANGDICYQTLRSNLQMQSSANVNAVVLLGTTGEPATVEDSERDLLVSTTVRQLKGKVPIMVGCGSPSTKKTIEMAKRAQDLGADAIQIIVPYLNKPTQEGLFLHFEAIAKAITLPICVYNIPGRCNVNLEVATLQKIAEFPHVIGVKECSGNYQQVTDIIEKICNKRANFSLICGDDPVTLPMMAVGAQGVMSVISNLLPHATVQLVQAMQAGNLFLARSLHYAMKPLLDVIFVESNPIPIKHLMHLANLDTSIMRLPLTPASRANKLKLEECFEACRNIIESEAMTGAIS